MDTMKVLILLCALVGSAMCGIIPSGYEGYEDNSLGHGGGGLSVHAHEDAQIGPHGEPLDTDEVLQAKAIHFAEVAKAVGRLAAGPHAAEQVAPVDEPAVQVARWQHEAAHHEAVARLHGAPAPQPLETPEVQVARHEHLEAVEEAKLRQHNPAVAHAALPQDTWEVQQAKVQHFAAHAAQQAHAIPSAEHQLQHFQAALSSLQPQDDHQQYDEHQEYDGHY